MRVLIILALASFFACSQTQQPAVDNESKEAYGNVKPGSSTVADTVDVPIVKKSEKEWKAELTKEEYYILREKGTERSFTSDLLSNKEKGTYVCAACQLPLFESRTKFKSGTGWPSFWEPIKASHVHQESDTKYGMVRTEVLCGACGGHLGHVFDDGPNPTGLRYCINGVSLDFVKKD